MVEPAPYPVAHRAGDRAAELQRLERLAHWLDSRFAIPGTGIRFGLDGLLGLLPGVGDVATMLPAVYLILQAHRLGAPRALLVRMALNVGLDTVVGAVPLLGDLFDVAFKANRRNVALLRRHLVRADPAAPSS